MAEFNRHTFPAGGGWVFRQPQTGWVNPMAMVGFDASVKAILQHRQANKAIVLKYKLPTNRETVEEELENYTRTRLGIPLKASPSFFQRSSNRLPPSVVAVAADIKRAAQGTAVVMDWLLSGGNPIAQELADRRASVCIQCPRNVDGSWYTVAPAELIRETLEARKDLKLATPHDSSLKSCDVCKCLMRLKVWTPLDFILNRTKPEIMAEFPPHCWIARHDA